MTLAPDTQVGPYRVVALVGEGGMGLVYRARDTRLGREVALKVLPEALASDPERIARFEREARTLAALNHPHIAQIHGLEESGDVRALVMEFVDGPTLADRLAHGALPLEEALPIATQIAEALEAAHEQGIIHRDLKPANIKVRDDGTVKVLDFGLAKALGPDSGQQAAGSRQGAAGSDTPSMAPTITSPALLTGAGMILGTAAYMSPEQAKGRPADKRSDVWAFGAVLYEMLTGVRAFTGDDMVDVLGAVARLEPDWAKLPPATPAPTRLLVQQCLAKDRKNRLGDIAGALFVLRGHSALTAIGPTSSPANGAPFWRRMLPIAVAVLLGAALASASAAWLRSGTVPAPAPVIRFSVTGIEVGSLTARARRSVGVSPDGTRWVYVGEGALHVRGLGDTAALRLAGSELSGGAFPVYPTFSPDGQEIAFHSAGPGTVYRIPVGGGTAQRVAERAGDSTGLSWGEDGIVFSTPDQILRVAPAGGDPDILVSASAGEILHAPQMLPGGTHLLYSIATSTEAFDTSTVVIQTLATGEKKTVLRDAGGGARYVTSGHLVYAQGGSLVAIPFDATTLETTAKEQRVIDGVRRGLSGGIGATRPADFAVSTTGTLVYVAGPGGSLSNPARAFVLSRGSASSSLPIPAGEHSHPRVSPDGRQLTYESVQGGKTDVWVYSLSAGTAPRRLTFSGSARYPVWSGDGRFIVFQSEHEGDKALFRQRADGAGQIERLTKPEPGTEHIPQTSSPDDAHLLFTLLKGARHTLYDLKRGSAASPFGNVESAETIGATFSPDGRWVAYASSDRSDGVFAPNRGIYVQPFPATGARYQAPKSAIDFHPAWAADGKSIYYVPGALRTTVRVDFQTTPAPAFGMPTATDLPLTGLQSGRLRGYDTMLNGGVITLAETTPASSQFAVNIVVNWFEELKRLVPTP